MSVRKGDRDEGDLEVINTSRILLGYTYDRVKDKNIFAKADRWLLPKNIWDCAVSARACICRANDIRVENEEDAKERLLLEKKAIGYLGTLETLVDLANMKGLISDDRMDFWEGLIDDTMVPLKGWLKSDRRRYKSFLK